MSDNTNCGLLHEMLFGIRGSYNPPKLDESNIEADQERPSSPTFYEFLRAWEEPGGPEATSLRLNKEAQRVAEAAALKKSAGHRVEAETNGNQHWRHVYDTAGNLAASELFDADLGGKGLMYFDQAGNEIPFEKYRQLCAAAAVETMAYATRSDSLAKLFDVRDPRDAQELHVEEPRG